MVAINDASVYLSRQSPIKNALARARTHETIQEKTTCPARVIKHGRKKARISFPSDGALARQSVGVRVTRNPTVYRLSNNYFSSKGNEGGYDERSVRGKITVRAVTNGRKIVKDVEGGRDVIEHRGGLSRGIQS